MGKPNIVFIMADDMGYGDLGCYGALKIPTPNIDRLAREGMCFTDAHSSSAVCTPSRYSVLTGRYCWRTWLDRWVIDGLGAPVIEPGRLTVASLLKRNGYATGAFGKWHLGFEWISKSGQSVSEMGNLREEGGDGFDIDYEQPLRAGPLDHGFDRFFGISGSLDMPPYCFIENDHTVGIPRREKDQYLNQQRRGLMVEGWQDDLVDVTFARKAAAFIEEQGGGGTPFFAYLPLSAPHRPCVPPDFLEGKSQAGDRGDMVCVVDWCVGHVMETLAQLDIADNTLVIVTSDNGARLACANGEDYGHKSNGDLRGQKADIWDGGHREPFVARWPGSIQPGATCGELVCLGDLIATCADIVGESLPEDAAEDSFSILPALLGEETEAPVREAIVHHSGGGMFSIRAANWKLILGLGSGGFTEPAKVEYGPDDPPGQLYDLAADPAETTNLYPDRPDIVERLSVMLSRYRDEGRSR